MKPAVVRLASVAQVSCRYCATIQRYDSRYPLRPARHALRSSHPRCDWHWRFTCAVCGNARHFHAIAFCPRDRKLFCLDCAPEHRAPRSPFWAWSYYYRMRCPWHPGWHPALDRAEHDDHHPWQAETAWAAEGRGLTESEEIPERWSVGIAPLDTLTDAGIRAAWDRVAPWWLSRYTARGDINREWIIDPVLLEFLGSVRGRRILDAGCGGGYLSRLLARRGGTVDGVDVSAKLIATAEAEEKKDPLRISYRRADLAHLPFADGTFDATVCNIVLQDVRRYREAIQEIHRVLRPGGSFVFSITHPAFEAPVPGRWVREPKDTERIEDRRYLRVDRYFDRVAVVWSLPGLPPLPGFHRPLRDYFAALSDAGFLVARLEEPRPTPKALERHFRVFADLERIPIFLVVSAVKPTRSGPNGFKTSGPAVATTGEARLRPRRRR